MTVYQKISGVWTPATRPYYKVGNVWYPTKSVHFKDNGIWHTSYEFDLVPPNTPQIELSIVENDQDGRWIRVGVRTTGVYSDSDLQLIRVLTTYEGAMPTTPYGGTYTRKSDTNWPNEAWSDWKYNSYGDHGDTHVVSYKQWPLNPGTTTSLAAGTYHFGVWSLDNNGNWSAGVFTSIEMPKKGVNAPNIVVKEARFQANSSGSYTSAGYTAGQLVQQGSPRSRGLWFHGNQISEAMGNSGAVTIRNAQIQVSRTNDSGAATANVYLFHHGYATASALPGSSPTFSEATKVGTINKGETKWFTIPETFYDNFDTGIKGFGLSDRDPAKASAFPEDYSIVQSTIDSLRSGEVHVVWKEQL